jgi:hypothetical protein
MVVRAPHKLLSRPPGTRPVDSRPKVWLFRRSPRKKGERLGGDGKRLKGVLPSVRAQRGQERGRRRAVLRVYSDVCRESLKGRPPAPPLVATTSFFLATARIARNPIPRRVPNSIARLAPFATIASDRAWQSSSSSSPSSLPCRAPATSDCTSALPRPFFRTRFLPPARPSPLQPFDHAAWSNLLLPQWSRRNLARARRAR